MDEEKKEALKIAQIAILNIQLSNIGFKLKELGINDKTIFSLSEVTLQIGSELEKMYINFEFNRIIKGLEEKK